jgi:hypothetical protein
MSEEEDDILIEPSDDSPPSFTPASSDVPLFNEAGCYRLKAAIQAYNALFPFAPADLDPSYVIHLNLLRDFLPLAMQCSYGYLNHPHLLSIEVALSDFSWNTQPTHLVACHPIYGNAYVGQGLVITAIRDFFTEKYRPRFHYRSQSRLLAPTGLVDDGCLAELLSQGFGENAAVRALLACSNNLRNAIDFLRTGSDADDQRRVGIEYATCPLLFLVLEIAEAFMDLSDHCCLCRTEMPDGLKPWVCSRELCIFQHSRLGVGNSVSQEIQRDPLVADLLVTVFAAAATGRYLADMPPSLKELDVAAILGGLPAMEAIARGVSNDQELTGVIGPPAVQLLRWILMSNRNHLISLKEGTIDGAGHQFLTLLASPEQEIVFEHLKKQYGSCLLWHGSAGDRWHAIIRNGLKNFSNTPDQANGAVRGPGIYLARDSSTSMGYSQRGLGMGRNHYKNSQLGHNVAIMALCEIARIPSDDVTVSIQDLASGLKQKSVRGHLKKHGSGVYTLTMEEACIVRELFVGDLRFSINSIKSPPKVLTLKEVLDEHAKSAM